MEVLGREKGTGEGRGEVTVLVIHTDLGGHSHHHLRQCRHHSILHSDLASVSHLVDENADHSKSAHAGVRHVAQHDVHQDGPDPGVDPGHGLHPRQHGVGHALRDVHDGHGEAGHEVTDEVIPPAVVGEPGEDGDEGEEVAPDIVTGERV